MYDINLTEVGDTSTNALGWNIGGMFSNILSYEANKSGLHCMKETRM
jgi:hypothetical protein